SPRRRRSPQNFRTYQPDHHRLLRMQPILGLIKHDGARSVDHLDGDFLAAMRRQAMHYDRALARILQQRVVDLEPLEVAPALRRFFLTAHRSPGVGVNDVRVLYRLGRVVSERADFLAPQPIDESLVWLVTLGASQSKLETGQRSRFDPALCEVESITHKCDADFPEVAPEVFLQCHQIGEQLARMKQIGEPIDDRHCGLARKLNRGLVREGANHDQIHGPRNVTRDVLDRFALPNTDIIRCQINRMPTKLRHAGLERDSRPQRRLLKYHRERLAAQVRMLESYLELGLEPRAQRDQSAEFS